MSTVSGQCLGTTCARAGNAIGTLPLAILRERRRRRCTRRVRADGHERERRFQLSTERACRLASVATRPLQLQC